MAENKKIRLFLYYHSYGLIASNENTLKPRKKQQNHAKNRKTGKVKSPQPSKYGVMRRFPKPVITIGLVERKNSVIFLYLSYQSLTAARIFFRLALFLV